MRSFVGNCLFVGLGLALLVLALTPIWSKWFR